MYDNLDDKILKTAKLEFIQKGYQNASIDRMAKELKIGKGTIYRHFGKKSKLFSSVIIDTLQEIYQSQSKVLENNHFYECFEEFLWNIKKYNLENSEIYKLIFIDKIFNELQKEMDEIDYKNLLDEFQKIIFNLNDLLNQIIMMGINEGVITKNIKLKSVSFVISLIINLISNFSLKKLPIKQFEFIKENMILDILEFIYRGLGVKEELIATFIKNSRFNIEQ